jgi:hypothetical protein
LKEVAIMTTDTYVPTPEELASERAYLAFAKLEYKRRLALRLAHELSTTLAMHGATAWRIAGVLRVFADEVLIANGAKQYDGDHLILVTRSHLEAMALRDEMLHNHAHLRDAASTSHTASALTVRAFAALSNAIEQFRQTGEMLAAMLPVDDSDSADDD